MQSTTELTVDDPATKVTYARNKLDISKNTSDLTYTSARVSKSFYNVYAYTHLENGQSFFGYYSNQAPYDERLVNENAANENCGRGVDFGKLINIPNYDLLILGYAALVSDAGKAGATVEKAADLLGVSDKKFAAISSYPNLDMQINRNCGHAEANTNPVKDIWNAGESVSKGMFGGMKVWRDRFDDDRIIGLSIGGWLFSEPFRRCGVEGAIESFTGSVYDFRQRFPSFTHLDINWQYPNSAGNGQAFGPEDPTYLKEILKSLRLKLRPEITVSIALPSDPSKIRAANLPLYDEYVNSYNVLPFDSFDGAHSRKLAHHNAGYKLAVDLMINQLKIAPNKINIGYATFTRNALGSIVTSSSPLRGTCVPSAQICGTFESGVTEWYDLLHNYLEFDPVTGLKGKNGFELYCDEVADADFLYNKNLGLFMSIETPRTVYAKARYVRERKLGGLFACMVEHDLSSLLHNAAHEGLGDEGQARPTDMTAFYKKSPLRIEDAHGNNSLYTYLGVAVTLIAAIIGILVLLLKKKFNPIRNKQYA